MMRVVKVGIPLLVVAMALAAAGFKYWDYMANPWTRDGQVRAYIVKVAPQVSGPIVALPIKNNRFVEAGDLLFGIDPRIFAATRDQRSAELDKTRDDIAALEKQVEAAQATVEVYQAAIDEAEQTVKANNARLVETEADFKRFTELAKKGAAAQREADRARANFEVNQANLDQARAALLEAKATKLQAEADLARAQADLGAPGDENAQLRAAKAALKEAELNLEFTEVRAPVDGWVTNLELRLGSQAVEDESALALVAAESFWIDAYFTEDLAGRIKPGNPAYVTLMSYPDVVLSGKVDSIAWGIAQEDGSTGENLLPNVEPTYEWIRLAERVPVLVILEELEGVDLRVGTSASVMVRTDGSDGAPPPAPTLLQ